MTYRHAPTLGDPRAVDSALQEIAVNLADLPKVPLRYQEPQAPEIGTLVLADGTTWNPGSGRGVYYWDGSWVKL